MPIPVEPHQVKPFIVMAIIAIALFVSAGIYVESKTPKKGESLLPEQRTRDDQPPYAR